MEGDSIVGDSRKIAESCEASKNALVVHRGGQNLCKWEFFKMHDVLVEPKSVRALAHWNMPTLFVTRP